jgi:hypothetical protein
MQNVGSLKVLLIFISPKNLKIRMRFTHFQPTDALNCHLIHNNIFKNTELQHVSDLTGPSPGLH